jgi:hypothetical protein
MAWWRSKKPDETRWICPFEGCEDYIIWNPAIDLNQAIFNHVLHLHPVDLDPTLGALLTKKMRKEYVEFCLKVQTDNLIEEMGQME